MKLFSLFFCVSLFFSCTKPAHAVIPPYTPDPETAKYAWIEQVREEHPRLFLTKEDVPQIRRTAYTFERGTFDQIKSRVDPLIGADIVFEDPLTQTGEGKPNLQYGYRTGEAAIMWLITEDERYLELTKKLLREVTDYYQLRVDHDLNIEWYAFSQICVLCAYDWIYNDLTPSERDSYGLKLYKAVDGIAWHGPGIRKARFRENVSDYKSGCYGVAILPWFLGLTFHKEGIDDAKCRQMLVNGYDLHQQMIAYRASMAGKNGGGASAVAQYSMGYYPFAEYDFIYTFHSATGIDPTEKMEYMLGYLNFMDWIRLPDNKEYGFGDVHHNNCKLPHRDMNAHVAEIANLFGQKHPEILPTAARLLRCYNERRPMDAMPFLRLLHKVDPLSGEFADQGIAGQPKSLYFDTMGQLYMRSGVGDDDTYALFVTGGKTSMHKHFDNNNFIIYKNGYRALDSGTRPEPGNHLNHYYARTVAHNCITIRMPGETFPKYWGKPAASEEELPIPNDGGQCDQLGSRLLEHVETPDYVYVASDATDSYNSRKAELVVREMVWCQPDVFVVFDRVVSTKPEYEKKWLYHLACEPKIRKMEFSETSRGGKSICRTLYPEDAQITKIGGPGKQFWSDGQNWPLPVLNPGDYGYANRHLIPPEDHPEIGQWRIEVAPAAPAKENMFMHIIQVGNEKLKKLPATTLFEDERYLGVEFEYEDKLFKLSFDKTAPSRYGCQIEVTPVK